jgi:hypothetical protein
MSRRRTHPNRVGKRPGNRPIRVHGGLLRPDRIVWRTDRAHGCAVGPPGPRGGRPTSRSQWCRTSGERDDLGYRGGSGRRCVGEGIRKRRVGCCRRSVGGLQGRVALARRNGPHTRKCDQHRRQKGNDWSAYRHATTCKGANTHPGRDRCTLICQSVHLSPSQVFGIRFLQIYPDPASPTLSICVSDTVQLGHRRRTDPRPNRRAFTTRFRLLLTRPPRRARGR